MKNFITLYKQTLSPQTCEALIQKFEANPALFEQEFHQEKKDNWTMQFTQINLSKHNIFKKEESLLKKLFLEAIDAYKKEHHIQSGQWPKEFSLEPLRMKRYLPNSEDVFDAHVDVLNHDTARRFLVMFIYLNEDFEGGETDFPQLELTVQAKQGNMILFPPMWAWWHKANPVKGKTSKYIVGTYMHFVVNGD
jgi:hypothetical protein